MMEMEVTGCQMGKRRDREPEAVGIVLERENFRITEASGYDDSSIRKVRVAPHDGG